jgi:hypothetical protein
MNRGAGWQEAIFGLASREEEGHAAGKALRASEPLQIAEPGSPAACSNWGAAPPFRPISWAAPGLHRGERRFAPARQKGEGPTPAPQALL